MSAPQPARPRKITIIADGPYVVEGSVSVTHQHIVTNEQGESLEWREGEKVSAPQTFKLCRCGQSKSKPFCDGSHRAAGFDGTETASREPYAAQAQRIEGPSMVLDDQENLCAFARFCDPHGQVWNLVGKTDNAHARKWVEHEAGHCPGGRLVARDLASGKALEPQFEPSIGLVQDTAKQISGPLWVRGGIPVVGADGINYEIRNRVTLCRCGASSNKPFCDGSHAATGFSDRK